jgi:PBP1b-binding outer membrane lipoprotein LpoB
MRYKKSNRKLRLKAVQKAKELMDNSMPRNTNFTSSAARQRISEIIIDMIFSEFEVEEKSTGILKRLKKRP